MKKEQLKVHRFPTTGNVQGEKGFGRAMGRETASTRLINIILREYINKICALIYVST